MHLFHDALVSFAERRVISMNKVEIQNLVGGQLQEKFEHAFEKVLENLQDPNTSFKVKRGITIKLDFVQNEKRDDVLVSVDVSEKLAPQAGMKTSFSIGKDLQTGEIYAEEYGKQIKGQMNLFDIMDPETGEVIEQNQNIDSNKVVDLRKAF